MIIIKQVVRASVQAFASKLGIKSENVLEIVFDRITQTEVAAGDRVSEIKPLSYKPEGMTEADRIYDDEAVEQFIDFCIDVEEFIKDNAEILANSFSTDTMSYYITFFSKGKEKSIREEYMFFVRTSDHALPIDKREYVKKINRATFKKHKRASTLHDGIREYDIIVNETTHRSYSGALKDVKARLNGLMKRNK